MTRRPRKPSRAALDAARRAQAPDPDPAAVERRSAGAVISRQAVQQHLATLPAHAMANSKSRLTQ